MSNVGKWTDWYRDLGGEPWPYGDTTSYEIGAAWLQSCALVEDWGCGAGWLRTLVPPERYRGIDGTASPFCDEAVDLTAIAFRLADITDRFPPDVRHTVRRIASATQYGSETILLLERTRR